MKTLTIDVTLKRIEIYYEGNVFYDMGYDKIIQSPNELQVVYNDIINDQEFLCTMNINLNSFDIIEYRNKKQTIITS